MPTLPPALARRLAAYSAASGLALAAAPAVSAQVVYTDLDPDVVVRWSNTYDLDFDGDNVRDAVAFLDTFSGPGSIFANLNRPPGGALTNSILCFTTVITATSSPGYTYTHDYTLAKRFGSGSVIGPAPSPLIFYRYGTLARRYRVSVGDFLGREGFAGFRFLGGDGTLHYGWVRLSVASDFDEIVIYDYAYEATPDTPIEAGEVPAATLEGSITPDTFPASGGILFYTVTITNTTDAPLPFDLWAEGSLADTTVIERLLSSETLPAGASVSRTLEFPILADDPPGTYDLRFKVGTFATREVISFERFEITKQPPVVGVEDVPTLATHTLSTAEPNPSTGRTALSLRVAEAQAVRVTVLDALGREVAVLHDGALAPDTAHRLVFDGSELPAGVYVVRAVGRTFRDTRVLTFTR